MHIRFRLPAGLRGAGLCALALALPAANSPTASPAAKTPALFPDEVVCQGKGVQIRRSDVDLAFLQFQANENARGRSIPEARRDELEARLLDRLLITQLLLDQATDADKTQAKALADKFVTETRTQAGSPEAFQRQLTAMGFTEEQFLRQIMERAICEEVVDRALKSQVTITDAQVKRYYDENADKLQRPEMVKVKHVFLSTRDPNTMQELSDQTRKAKREQIDKVLARARQGENFDTLVAEFSEDPRAKEKGGEYIFARGQMPLPFETAAFSLQTGQVSDVVTTTFGYHIIRLNQRIPAEPIELAKIQADVRDKLARVEVQEKLLPDYLKKLKAEASLQFLHGAQPIEAFDKDAKPELGGVAPAR
jgi:peptidyl-prolyl cis-trans isomerase C